MNHLQISVTYIRMYHLDLACDSTSYFYGKETNNMRIRMYTIFISLCIQRQFFAP